MQTNDTPNNIQWHPAFHGATRLELRADLSKLEILPEFSLSKEPLRIDVLVIRKSADDQIENEVGRIFKGHNIIEYKSPDDGLTIDDYFKTVAYACLYKALSDRTDGIPESEITVSLFREAYPRELFACFRKSGRTLVEKYPGVYYVTGNILFDTQIVVMNRLDKKVHKAYRILSRNMEEEDAEAFLNDSRKYTTKAEKEDMNALLSVSVAANLEVYEKIRRNLKMSDVLEYLMRDVIEAREQKVVKEAEIKIRRAEAKVTEAETKAAQAEAKAAKAETKAAEAETKAAKAETKAAKAAKTAKEAEKKSAQETKLTDIKNIMNSLKLTSEQAMNALQISPAEQEIYLKRLEQQI